MSATRVTPRHRLMALGSIAAAAAALVVGAASLPGDTLRAAATVVVLLVAIAAAWTAATRTRAVRWVAAGACLLALAVAAELVVTAEARGLGLLVVAGSALTSIVLCRHALAPFLPRSDQDAPPVAVPPARHGVLLMNPRSGGGKVERHDLPGACRARGIEPVVLQPGDDLRALAEHAIARGSDVIGMAGGDGSQALVAAVAAASDVAMVCVPAGTRNHFALDLGLDRDDVVGALDAFGAALERRIDLATVGGRVFVNNVSLGVYASIVQSHDYREAKARTTATLLPELLGSGSDRFDLRYPGPDGEPRGGADVVQVSNNAYTLTSLTGFGTRAHLDAGRLGIATMEVRGAAGAAALVAAGSAGRLDRCPGWAQWTAERFAVWSSEPIAAGVDGEALLLTPPLRFEILPRALRVRVPAGTPSATRRPPAAPPWWTLVALARVAAGSSDLDRAPS